MKPRHDRASEPMTSRGPLTDGFGTRLDAREMLATLARLGVDRPQLIIRDEGLVLECDDPDPRCEATARSLSWLRDVLAPHLSLRARPRGGGGPSLVDQRRTILRTLVLGELVEGHSPLSVLGDLLRRLGEGEPEEARGGAETMAGAAGEELAELLGTALGAALPARATVSTLAPSRNGGLRVRGALASTHELYGGPHLLTWLRPGGERGVRPARLLAASRSLAPLRWLARALCGVQPPLTAGDDILLDGLAWKASRRPIVATPAEPAGMRIHIDRARCTECGICAQMCPEGYLLADGRPATDDVSKCTRCYDCVEACPTDAIRPTHAADTATLASALERRPTWLSRLAGLPGPSFPAPFPPSYLLPSSTAGGRYVLGLAVADPKGRAAALLRDGEIVAAVEEDKLVGTAKDTVQPSGSGDMRADPMLAVEQLFCWPAIRAVLTQEGITLDDVDVIAINELQRRHVDPLAAIDAGAAPRIVRTGRVAYVPYHRAQAASAFHTAAAAQAWVFSIGGGSRHPAASVWRGSHGLLEYHDSIRSLTTGSIDGVCEQVSRLLGFGAAGQEQVEALAASGRPAFDLSQFLNVLSDGSLRAAETEIAGRFAHLARRPGAALAQDHKDLAASAQAALERVVLALVRRRAGRSSSDSDAVVLAGGVVRNARLNEHLRRAVHPQPLIVAAVPDHPGSALGAAIEARAQLAGSSPPVLVTPLLGPEHAAAVVEEALRRSGLRYVRCESIARTSAERIAAGEVVCWFQGRLELGPRPLGASSILADPRRPAARALVNAIKQREPWRPLAASVLAGHERDWVEDGIGARFMELALPVRHEQRERVPAIVHADGTTCLQVVHPGDAPLYHALLTEFHRLTGIPLLLNTSLNRSGDPPAGTPEQAIECFVALGADALAVGSFLVERERAAPKGRAPGAELARLPGGRRLLLRLTARCDLDCVHCPVQGERESDRSRDDAVRALAEARTAGCDELVLLRGEAALRQDLAEIIATARPMGFRFVQLQTHAAALCERKTRAALLAAGVDRFEVQLLAAEAALHDRLSGSDGSFRRVLRGLRALAAARAEIVVTVPVLAGNLKQLGKTVALAHALGVRTVQLSFPQPPLVAGRFVTAPLARLSLASHCVRQAAAIAQRLGMTVRTEGFPFCHLPMELRATDVGGLERLDDLRRLHDPPAAAPTPLPCRGCSVRHSCPKTWPSYLELYGSAELQPIVESTGTAKAD